METFVLCIKGFRGIALTIVLIWQFLVFIFFFTPPLLTYYKHGYFQYLKGFGVDKRRKLIILSICTGILIWISSIIPLNYQGKLDSIFGKNLILYILCLCLIILMYMVNRSLLPQPLFQLIRNFYTSKTPLEELLEEKVDPLAMEVSPVGTFKAMTREKKSQEDLELILLKYESVKIGTSSIRRLINLIEKGELFDKDEKIIIEAHFIKDGQIDQDQIVSFLNEIYDIEYFASADGTKIPLQTFINYLNGCFLIKLKDETSRRLYYNAFARWIKRKKSVNTNDTYEKK